MRVSLLKSNLAGTDFLFVLIFLLWFPNESVKAQNFDSLVSWHHMVYDVRVLGLGQATSALNNNSAYHANPAIPSETGVIDISGFIPGTKISNMPQVFSRHREMNHYNPAIRFTKRNFTYSASANISSYRADRRGSESYEDIQNTLIRLQTGFRITNTLYTGVELFYNSLTQYRNVELFFDDNRYPAKAWGISIGAYYRDHWKRSSFTLQPQIGISVNNLSNGFYHKNSVNYRNMMPGQVRLGLGLDIASARQMTGRSILGIGVYTSFNKYLNRATYDSENQTIDIPNGYRALFSGWNSFDWFDGSHYQKVTLGDQISASIGTELQLLETLYFRYGVMTGAELWAHPHSAYGAEIDLFYLSFSISKIDYHSSNLYQADNSALTFAQTTIRIPLGRSKDTLLGSLFER